MILILAVTLLILAAISGWITVWFFWKAVQMKKQKPKEPLSCLEGGHVFRSIASPYIKQCQIPACGIVVYTPDANGVFPDGLREYTALVTRGVNCLPGDFPHPFKPDDAFLPEICGLCGRDRASLKHVC